MQAGNKYYNFFVRPSLDASPARIDVAQHRRKWSEVKGYVIVKEAAWHDRYRMIGALVDSWLPMFTQSTLCTAPLPQCRPFSKIQGKLSRWTIRQIRAFFGLRFG
ncbi:hypothetical protein A7D16_20610 [Xanthomonas nasturtii]|nr:hypothetical protein A7D16_20610 [Xanthomonas nasturtii]